MYYQICPACGDALSPLILSYAKDMKDLCTEYDIDHDRISAQPLGDTDFNKKKQAIMDKYVPKDRLCCRSHLCNFSDSVKLVR